MYRVGQHRQLPVVIKSQVYTYLLLEHVSAGSLIVL